MCLWACACMFLCEQVHMYVCVCVEARSQPQISFLECFVFFFLITFKHLPTNCVSVHKPQ